MAGKLRSLLSRSRTPSNEPDAKYGATPLYYACQRGQLAEVRRLLGKGDAPLEGVNTVVPKKSIMALVVDDSRIPSSMYRTPLHIACARGHLLIVRELLSHPKLDVNQLVNNITPLQAAILNGQLNVVELLLEDPRIDVNAQDEQGNTAMHLCCSTGATEALMLLLQEEKITTQTENHLGQNPYMTAVVHNQCGAALALRDLEVLHWANDFRRHRA